MSGERSTACTHTAMSPQGDIYVSEWPEMRVRTNTAPQRQVSLSGRARQRSGEFRSPTTSPAMPTVGSCGRPREPSRAGVRRNGNTRRSGTDLHGRAACSCRRANAQCATSARSATEPISRNVPNFGPRVTIVDHTGKVSLGSVRAWSDRVPSAARARRGQPRRPLCRRGVVDGLAAIFCRQTPARQFPARCTSSGKWDRATCARPPNQ